MEPCVAIDLAVDSNGNAAREQRPDFRTTHRETFQNLPDVPTLDLETLAPARLRLQRPAEPNNDRLLLAVVDRTSSPSP
jgi:hypothetical protein